MELIFQVPFIIRVLAALGLMLVIYRVSKSLIIALVAGSLVLAIWCGHSPADMAAIVAGQANSPDNLFLLLIVLQTVWLSTQMKESGIMQDLMNTVSKKLSQKYSLAVLPALIGLLPMPGGALFSAPMLQDVDAANEVSALDKTKINYWFRHIWEYWWPIYPGVLLAIEITGLQIWQFILLALPLSVCAVAGGIFFLLRPLRLRRQKQAAVQAGPTPHIILLALPIMVIIAAYALLSLTLPALAGLNRYLPMIMAITCAQIVLYIMRPLALKKLFSPFLSLNTYKIILIVALIRVYGAFIEARLRDGVLLTAHMREELLLLQIPVLLVIMIIPFLSGLTTGLSVGYVGASFPIVISLLGADPPLGSLLSYTIVAHGFGYIGMMLSPLHVCHLVTSEYFKTNLVKSIGGILKPSLVVLGGALLVYFICGVIFVK